MAAVCVIGGTRFFGKILVWSLLAKGHEVTILTRGQAGDEFGDQIHRLRATADDADALATAVAGRAFDTVFHQVCYTPVAALAATAAFRGRAGRLVMTSTMDVYNRDTFRDPTRPAPPLRDFAAESELDLAGYGYDASLPWLDEDFHGANYAEGKRQAESALAQTGDFPVISVRAAHVMADRDEFTGRFAFHVDRIMRGQRMIAHRNPGRTCYVHADDLAAFLAWLTESELTGAVNACSPEGATVYDMVVPIEQAAGRSAVIEEVDQPWGHPDMSAFSCPADFGMSVEMAAEHGYKFASIHDWLPKIAARAVAEARG